MFRMIKRAQVKLARVGAKTKGAVVAVGATVGATASQAAITFSPESGFSGSIETTFYTSAVVVIVSFLALAIAIGYGIRAFKKG